MTGPTVCAWCGKTMTEGDPTLDPSHGICSKCIARIAEFKAMDPVRNANHFAGGLALAFLFALLALLLAGCGGSNPNAPSSVIPPAPVQTCVDIYHPPETHYLGGGIFQQIPAWIEHVCTTPNGGTTSTVLQP